MNKLKKIFTNTRVIILIVALLLCIWLIAPSLTEGVSIRGVAKNSAASEAIPRAITSPESGVKPMSREVIQTVNDKPITTVKDYFDSIAYVQPNQTVKIKTSKDTYFVTAKPKMQITYLNETEVVVVNTTIFNETLNTTQNITKREVRNKTIEEVVGIEDLGITVYQRPKNNIQKGLDLEGGTRVLLEPEEEVTTDDLAIIVESIKQRLDVYGVSDVTVRTANDFFGKTFIIVEIAGANEQEVKSLLSEQGKFEAMIGQTKVFIGGEKDVLRVCRTADCSGIDPRAGCNKIDASTVQCRFRFAITLSKEAAQRQAAATANLKILSAGLSTQNYLSENLTLYLDDEKVDELRIGSELKGNPVTDIEISGSGQGTNERAARQDALNNMKTLQTVLVTGSLPVKLRIVKTDTISPALGEDFVNNALLVGLIAMIAVMVIIVIRYRELKISIPIGITIVSEVLLTLGFAAMIGWRMDMASLAAIIIAVGAGVNDQIVITDETLSKGRKESETMTWKEKMKRAFFIVLAAYFTLAVAMLPLWFAGAGLLKGFALTTLVGMTVGVLITRPAFSQILEILVEK